MKKAGSIFLLLSILFFLNGSTPVHHARKRFNVLALYENGGHHKAFTDAAKPWLDKLAADSNFAIDYIFNTNDVNEKMLKKYQLILQLDYPPYGWKDYAVPAFEKYIMEGRGGWVGLHHATLLGEFDGFPMWQWFSDFMGGIRFDNYIKDFAAADVKVEDSEHPVMKGVPSTFKIEKEEWYTWNKSPRSKVHVIASVDESTYTPDTKIKMGDHPVVWTNDKTKARNVYIFMGHGPDLLENKAYTTLLTNAIFWAASKN